MNTVGLATNISKLVANGDYVAGHSIFDGRGNANAILNKILKEGLIIHDSSRGLPFTSRCFENDCKSNLDSLIDLASVSMGFVVIISIPSELLACYDRNFFSSYDNTSILLKDRGKVSDYCTDIYGNPTQTALLPSSYIWGYLDVESDKFIENKHFIFNNKERSNMISLVKLVLDEKYKKMLKSFQKNRS